MLKQNNSLKGKELEQRLDAIIRQTFKLTEDDERLHGFSKSNRNFFIRLYNLSLKYPQIRYVTLPYSHIKARGLTRLRCMDNDKAFDWKAKLHSK